MGVKWEPEKDRCGDVDLSKVFDYNHAIFKEGQYNNSPPCKAMVCKKCGGVKFHVGFGENWYTAVKCPECGYEVCIHEG